MDLGASAARGDHQEGRSARLPHQCPHQRKTVTIGPLQIVDEDDHRHGPRQVHQQVTKRDERLVAQFLRVPQTRSEIAFVLGHLESPQHRKDFA